MAPLKSAVSHDDLGPELNAITALLLTLSAAFLGTRIWLKRSQGRTLWWDDYVLVVAWVIFLAGGSLSAWVVTLGYGRHVYDIPKDKLMTIGKWGSIAGTLNLVASSVSKTSFALTLLRLPVGSMKYFIWFIVVTMNILINTSAISVWIQCQPPPLPQLQGQPFPQRRFCLDTNVVLSYAQFAGAFSAAMDFTLAILPWKILWNLPMDRTEKAGVLFAMSMGIFAGLASAVRTSKITTIDATDLIEGVGLAAWGMAEVAVTIMAASTPILRALFPRSKEARMISEDRRQIRNQHAAARVIAEANLSSAQRMDRSSSLTKEMEL